MTKLPRHLWFLAAVPVLLVAGGTIGYWLIEPQYTLFDALYMTIITLSTIGYFEVHPLTFWGRVFTIFLILGGVFVLFFSATEMIRSIVSGEIAVALGKRFMERALAQMKDHIIVCGYGRIGRRVCNEFARLEKPFVVIDIDPAVVREFDLSHGVAFQGDATCDDVLRQAGIERAHSLVVAMASDSDNLFVTMSARLLSSKVIIIAKVEDSDAEQKVLRAGANRVVSPYRIGGDRIAHAVTKPTVVDFIELTTRTEHIELQLEEYRIEKGSNLAGKTLEDSKLMAECQVIIVAIKKGNGHMLFNPPAPTRIEAGDIMIAMGSQTNLDALEKQSSPS